MAKKPFPGWFVVVPWELAIGAAPKVATRSILFSIAKHFQPDATYESVSPSEWFTIGKTHGFHRYRPHEAHKRIPRKFHRVAIVRDPVERFASLWRCQIRDKITGILGDLNFSVIRTPEDLIQAVHNHPLGNVHWSHQHLFLKNAHEIVRFEDFPAWWVNHFGEEGPVLQHVNTTQGQTDIVEATASRVRNHYEQDQRIYDENG